MLGIALHARVDGSVNPQSVGVDIVGCTIRLEVALAPASQSVFIPFRHIKIVLFFRIVVFALGFGSVHHGAKVFSEIGGLSRVVVFDAEMRHVQRDLGDGVVFGLGEVTVFGHLSEHQVAAFQ